MISLRKFERSLAVLAVISAAVLTLRAALGPFRIWGLHTVVNSPFFAENVFWVAIFGILCARYNQSSTNNPSSAQNFPRLEFAVTQCIVALAFIRNLADPFLSDDYIMMNTFPRSAGTHLSRN